MIYFIVKGKNGDESLCMCLRAFINKHTRTCFLLQLSSTRPLHGGCAYFQCHERTHYTDLCRMMHRAYYTCVTSANDTRVLPLWFWSSPGSLLFSKIFELIDYVSGPSTPTPDRKIRKHYIINRLVLQVECIIILLCALVRSAKENRKKKMSSSCLITILVYTIIE